MTEDERRTLIERAAGMKPAKLQEAPIGQVFAMLHNAHYRSFWPSLKKEFESRLGLCQGGEWIEEVRF